MSNDTEKKVYSARESFENEAGDKKEGLSEKKINNTRKRRIVVGGVFSVLAFVGILSIVVHTVKFGVSLFDNTEERQRFDSLLTALVLYDPLPFESPEEADQNVLLASTVWATIMNEDLTQYETDEYGSMYYLPAREVDRYYAKLFGTSTKLTHHTFSDSDIEFEYDEEKGTYAVPPTTYPSGYSPETVKISKSFGSNEKTVTVGYLSIENSITDTSARHIVKYVDYIFTKQDGDYYLTAVRDSDMKVEQSSSSAQ